MTKDAQQVRDSTEGFLRLPHILQLLPISRSAWWEGVKNGRYPKSYPIGPRTTAWRKRDIYDLLSLLEQGKSWGC